MALLVMMSRSDGIGDSTGLGEGLKGQRSESNRGTGGGSVWRGWSRGGSHLSGRMGSASRVSIPWIPWQSSAGIWVAWGGGGSQTDDRPVCGSPSHTRVNQNYQPGPTPMQTHSNIFRIKKIAKMVEKKKD